MLKPSLQAEKSSEKVEQIEKVEHQLVVYVLYF
jgi:hypothetical protein